jgi:hypothetical protein
MFSSPVTRGRNQRRRNGQSAAVIQATNLGEYEADGTGRWREPKGRLMVGFLTLALFHQDSARAAIGALRKHSPVRVYSLGGPPGAPFR